MGDERAAAVGGAHELAAGAAAQRGGAAPDEFSGRFGLWTASHAKLEKHVSFRIPPAHLTLRFPASQTSSQLRVPVIPHTIRILLF